MNLGIRFKVVHRRGKNLMVLLGKLKNVLFTEHDFDFQFVKFILYTITR